MKNFWKIISFGKPYKSYFILSLVFMVLNTIFEGVSIFSIVPFMDKVLTGKPIELTTSIKLPFMDQINQLLAHLSAMDRMQLFAYLGVFLIIMFSIKGVAYYYSQVLMEKLGQSIVKDIRCKLFDHMQHMSIDFFSHGKTGALMSRVTADVQMILEIISGRFASTLIELPKFIVYAAIVIIIDWKLVVALALLPVIILPIVLIGKKIRSLSRRAQNRLAELNSVLFEVITGIKIVQAFCMEDGELNRFMKENIKYYQTRIKAVKLDTLLRPLTEVTGILICLGIMFMKVPKIIDGTLSIGTFTLQAAALISLTKPMKTLGKINSLYQRAMGAAERIFQILHTKSSIVERDNPVDLAPIQTSIEFSEVSFSYEKDEHVHDVLNNISFSLKKGEIAAFVGPSGAGKTTILNMVPPLL